MSFFFLALYRLSFSFLFSIAIFLLNLLFLFCGAVACCIWSRSFLRLCHDFILCSRYKARKKKDIKVIIENAPDQNEINLSNAVLSEDQKTLLKKGPSFIPTPTNINWYDVRKDFTKFINKVRHFAGVSDQPIQQQKQQQQPEVNSENIVSTSINVFPPGKPPPVSSDSKQLYKSKQNNNSRLELFIDTIEK